MGRYSLLSELSLAIFFSASRTHLTRLNKNKKQKKEKRKKKKEETAVISSASRTRLKIIGEIKRKINHCTMRG